MSGGSALGAASALQALYNLRELGPRVAAVVSRLAAQVAEQQSLLAEQAAEHARVLEQHRAGLNVDERERELQHAAVLARKEAAATARLEAARAQHDAALVTAAEQHGQSLRDLG